MNLTKPMLAAAMTCLTGTASAQDICQGFGPQTPRDITDPAGTNARIFTPAPPSDQMNLCNIHTHTNAEHKGPGFAVLAGDGDYGGYRCNASDTLSAAELSDSGPGAYGNVSPGDTIEVHWVYSTCDVAPGEGLGACLSLARANPELRVEAQVFLLVNDPQALDFSEYTYDGTMKNGLHQTKSLPTGTGTPVLFAGSTTGPSYSQEICSPFQASWGVRPDCAKLDIGSLHKWAENGNVFNEHASHGVRQLVSAPELLAPIP